MEAKTTLEIFDCVVHYKKKGENRVAPCIEWGDNKKWVAVADLKKKLFEWISNVKCAGIITVDDKPRREGQINAYKDVIALLEA